MLTHLLADARYSLRSLAKRPVFAATVVVTLAVGIGINVAFYSIFEGMVLRPVPGAHAPDELVNLAAPGPSLKPGITSCGIAGDCEDVFSYPMFRDLERLQEPFTAIAAHRIAEVNLAYRGTTLSGAGVLVSGQYFGVLGVQPALGRLLGSQDDAVEGGADSVVLSYRYWQNVLGADPSAIGQALIVNGKPLTIVGVAGREFQGTSRPASPEVFLPITFRWRDGEGGFPNFDDRRYYWVYLFARLKSGVSATQAEEAINRPYRAILGDVEAPLQTGMTEQTLAQFRAKTVTVRPGSRGQSWVMTGADLPISILLAAAATVLLIVCVNITNLMLARGAARVGEMAVRLSIGAGPRRLMSLLFTEALLLALLAALLSLPLTQLALRWIQSFVPSQGGTSFDFGLNAGLVALAVVVALVAALAFALGPVLKLARTAPAETLRAHGTRSTGGKAAGRFRVALVTVQIAMSMMLLVLAGLLVHSLLNVANVSLGMRVDSMLSFSVAPERNGYSPVSSTALFHRIEGELAALPGVTSATSSMLTLLNNNSNWQNVRVPGFEPPSSGTNWRADFNAVGTQFFETLGLPLLAGRAFDAADSGAARPRVAVVNERFVEFFRLPANPIGTRIGTERGEAFDVEIVGVVRNAKYANVRDPIRPQLFMPRGVFERAGESTFYVRTAGDSDVLAADIRALVARLDPNLPIMNLESVERRVRDNVFLDRLMGQIAAALAALATLLAAVGLYGVLSYMVAQRTREMGLRMALGASPSALRGVILRQVALMAVVGGTIGIGAALLVGRAASSLLFGVSAAAPLVLLAAVGALTSIAFAAGYVPAFRASRIDPMTALRAD
jgi:predicted permease